MKRCLACQTAYETALAACPSCGAAPATIDGFRAYAPALAQASQGFKEVFFEGLARIEADSFWFRGRNRLIIWALQRSCPPALSFLEIGCGTGYVISGVAEAFPHATLKGSEIFTRGLAFAKQRLPDSELFQMDARAIPYRGEFDAIGAFDVLEHIAEDEHVLAEVHSALKPGGVLLASVPQHPWLWSRTDDWACHVRRYQRGELERKARAAGFTVLLSTSFVTTLLPAMLASRLVQRHAPAAEFDPIAEFKIPSALNGLFYGCLLAELQAIRLGVRLPVGGSRFLVARRG